MEGDTLRILRGDTSALPAARIRQGVTTELIGFDGNSHAPFKTQEDLQRYIELDSGLNGRAADVTRPCGSGRSAGTIAPRRAPSPAT